MSPPVASVFIWFCDRLMWPSEMPSPSKISCSRRMVIPSSVKRPHPAAARAAVSLAPQIIERPHPRLLGVGHLLHIADGIAVEALQCGVADQVEALGRPHILVGIV